VFTGRAELELLVLVSVVAVVVLSAAVVVILQLCVLYRPLCRGLFGWGPDGGYGTGGYVVDLPINARDALHLLQQLVADRYVWLEVLSTLFTLTYNARTCLARDSVLALLTPLALGSNTLSL
jgi:hypothetical protein